MDQNINLKDLLSNVALYADRGVFNVYRENLNIKKMASIVATLDTAQYYMERALKLAWKPSTEELISHGASEAKIEGLALEFGVAGGESIAKLHTALGQEIHGFDSFEGLPEDWRLDWRKGAFAQAPPLGLPDGVVLHAGLFADSLPAFIEAHAGPVRFLHVDCDLYSSTKTVFYQLADRIRPGTIILFDEYWNYIGWRHHEWKAFQEFVERRRVDYSYLVAIAIGPQVLVRIEAIG